MHRSAPEGVLQSEENRKMDDLSDPGFCEMDYWQRLSWLGSRTL